MLRFLMIIAFLALIANLLLKLLGYSLKRLFKSFSPPPPSSSPKPLDETLVRCETCHLFIPLSKASKQNDHYYCQEHHTKN